MNESWILSGSSIMEVLLIVFLISPEGKHNNLQHCSPHPRKSVQRRGGTAEATLCLYH